MREELGPFSTPRYHIAVILCSGGLVRPLIRSSDVERRLPLGRFFFSEIYFRNSRRVANEIFMAGFPIMNLAHKFIM